MTKIADLIVWELGTNLNGAEFVDTEEDVRKKVPSSVWNTVLPIRKRDVVQCAYFSKSDCLEPISGNTVKKCFYCN